MLLSFVLAALSAAAPSPIARLNYLVGTWSCTYRAGATRFDYGATYAYDRGGNTLRLSATWAGGGDEELFGYDAPHRAWTAVVFEDTGATTIMHATGSDANHIAYRSVYPDAGLAQMFDRISATQYTLHATVRSGGKTTVSTDTCSRGAR